MKMVGAGLVSKAGAGANCAVLDGVPVGAARIVDDNGLRSPLPSPFLGFELSVKAGKSSSNTGVIKGIVVTSGMDCCGFATIPGSETIGKGATVDRGVRGGAEVGVAGKGVGVAGTGVGGEIVCTDGVDEGRTVTVFVTGLFLFLRGFSSSLSDSPPLSLWLSSSRGARAFRSPRLRRADSLRAWAAMDESDGDGFPDLARRDLVQEPTSSGLSKTGAITSTIPGCSQKSSSHHLSILNNASVVVEANGYPKG